MFTIDKTELNRNPSLIHQYDIVELKEIYNLEFVLPKSISVQKKKRDDVGIFIHLFYEDLKEICFSYIKEVVKICDVYITTSKPCIQEYIQNECRFLNIDNCHIKLVQNRGHDIASLVVHHKNDILKYKYFCFTHDKKSFHIKNRETALIWFYDLWENTVASSDFIFNVIKTFDTNDLLGFLTVPQPFWDDFLFNMDNIWNNSYPDVVDLIKKLNLNCKISFDKSSFSIGTAFWAHTSVVQPLFDNFTMEDFPQDGVGNLSYAVERIFPYIAQHLGFYSGILTSDSFAAYRNTYFNKAFADVIKVVKTHTTFGNYKAIQDYLSIPVLIDNATKTYKRLYIYGAGKRASRFINNIGNMNFMVGGGTNL